MNKVVQNIVGIIYKVCGKIISQTQAEVFTNILATRSSEYDETVKYILDLNDEQLEQYNNYFNQLLKSDRDDLFTNTPQNQKMVKTNQFLQIIQLPDNLTHYCQQINIQRALVCGMVSEINCDGNKLAINFCDQISSRLFEKFTQYQEAVEVQQKQEPQNQSKQQNIQVQKPKTERHQQETPQQEESYYDTNLCTEAFSKNKQMLAQEVIKCFFDILEIPHQNIDQIYTKTKGNNVLFKFSDEQKNKDFKQQFSRNFETLKQLQICTNKAFDQNDKQYKRFDWKSVVSKENTQYDDFEEGSQSKYGDSQGADNWSD